MGGPDLSLVPALTLLFAVGMLGLHVPGDRLSNVATATTAVAIVAALASNAYLTAGRAPEDADAPAGVAVAYAAATIGILVALVLFGLAFRRARVLPPPWRDVPLASGVVWFPLEALTAILPDGGGLLLAGLAWLAVAPVIWRRRRAAGRSDVGVRDR